MRVRLAPAYRVVALPCSLLVLAALARVALCQDVSSAVQAFDEGNRLYSAGSYSAAVEAYEWALESGYGSAALFYNQGNAYYRLDQIGQAIRAYERARRLAPVDPRIQHNLGIARERTVDRFTRIPQPFWRVWWDGLSATLGEWGYFLIGAAFYMVASVLLVHRVLTGMRSAWLRRSFSGAAMLAVMFLIAAFVASVERQSHRSVVVLATSLALHQEPTLEAEVEVEVHEGLTADVVSTRESWLLLRIPNGVRGWAPADAVAEI